MNPDFDFDNLFNGAAIYQDTVEADDAEGYAFQGVDTNHPPFTSPLTPIAECSDSSRPPSPLSLPPPLVVPSTRRRNSASAISNQKSKSKRNRSLKRTLEKGSVHNGDYKLRPCTTDKHVKGAKAISSRLQTDELPATKSGYIGARGEEPVRESYGLDDFVGEHSKFRFRLVEWDGQ